MAAPSAMRTPVRAIPRLDHTSPILSSKLAEMVVEMFVEHIAPFGFGELSE